MSQNTYVALQTTTLGSSASSVTFSSIPQGYTDLVVVGNFLPSVSTNQPYFQFNADTGTSTTNYSTTSVRGDGSSAASGRHTNNFGWYPVPGPGIGTNGYPEPWIMNIMNYSNTTTYKTGISRFNNAQSVIAANAHLWRSLAAISTITITMETGNFNSGSTFTIYGVAAVPQLTAKATGGTIYYGADGYVYHKFTSNGTFTPSQALTCDYLVVAGGGGGAGHGAGGGAGGLRSTVVATGGGGTIESAVALSSGTGYTVTVGAGGAGWTSGSSPRNGGNGNNSVFGSITSIAGGGGGGADGGNGQNGGSGGGGNDDATAVGTGTANQGYAGGLGGARPAPSYNIYSGGGGGAGAVGGAAVSTVRGGNGGDGVAIYPFAATTSAGSSNYFAGGGGGFTTSGTQGTGGAGGGGAATTGAGTAGTTNTGSGGGGGAFNGGGGGNGGSGIVIVRYLG